LYSRHFLPQRFCVRNQEIC